MGDLGNAIANTDGKILSQFTDDIIQLHGAHSIIGRTIVLHALEDDLGTRDDTGSKTTGNSGARIACGAITYS